MIPKVIHYCWFGRKPLPELAQKCIASWRKYLPDYEIKEWNEDNFDVNIIHYTAEAYKAGKYAFVSDYARLWVLYKYGGLYFDTDVEIIKSIDDIILRGPFMGCENEVEASNSCIGVNPGLGLGAYPGLILYKELLDEYCNMDFNIAGVSDKQITIVQITTQKLIKEGLQNISELQYIAGIYIYPKEFFCPINFVSNKCIITSNTRTIHHYAGTWIGKKQKIYFWVARHISPSFAVKCSKIFKCLIAKKFI